MDVENTIINIDIIYVGQKYNWDCGLACIIMILKTLDISPSSTIDSLSKYCTSTTIWTTDLVNLLIIFDIKFEFYTIKLLPEKIKYTNRSFTINELWNIMLNNDSIILILIDSLLLYSDYSSQKEFNGHYVLLTGVDFASDQFIIANPGDRGKNICFLWKN